MSWLIYPSIQGPILASGQTPEAVTESRWHQPWSEPVRFKMAPLMAVVLAAASGNQFDPYPIPNANPFPDKFEKRWQEPVRIPPRLIEANQQTLAFVGFAPFAERPDESKWHQPWSDPQKLYKEGLLTAAQQADWLVQFSPFAETVMESKWHQPLSEPVRFPPRLGAELNPFEAHDWKIVPTQYIDRWLLQWTDPVRTPPRLNAALNPSAVLGRAAPFPESITEDRWHRPWSEPVRFKRIHASQQSSDVLGRAGPFPEAVPEDRWHQPFSEPVRFKPRLVTAAQQAAWFVGFSPFPETITESRWHQPWSEPKRYKPALHAALNPAQFQAHSAPYPESITEDRWHQPWSEPKRYPRQLIASAQMFFTMTLAPPTDPDDGETLKNVIVRRWTITGRA